MATENQIEKLVEKHGAKLRSQGSCHVDVEIKTTSNGYVSLSISTTERRFGGHGFNPQGWTTQHYLAANAAMATLLALADAIWELCEVK